MRRIELTQGKFALVSNRDFKKVSRIKWHAHWSGWKWYAGNSDGISMHRFIMGLKKGDKREIDHRDGNGLNNQRYNLRIATSSQNKINCPKRKGQFTSKYRGVYWDEKRKKWIAQICFNYKNKYIGGFFSEINAAKARDKKVIQLFGEYTCLNF